MKSIKYVLYSLMFVMTVACDQEVIDLQQPEAPLPDTSCEDAVAGSADFTKFIAIGNSFVAGVQGGALFTDGQNNSLPVIINKQLECAGASSTFNQPDIKASLGWNLFSQPFLLDNTKPIEGRLLLQYSSTPNCKTNASDPDVFTPKPTAQKYGPDDMEALPSPSNTNFIYTGSKTALNNFGVPVVLLGQSLITQTGAWAGAGVDPRFNIFYGRFAYPGTGTSTIIGDAAAAGGTFFMFWLGLDDFFLYAAYGGDPTKAPLTTSGNFSAQYGAAIGALLNSNPNLNGVVGNFPDIFVMPHFTSVTYNAIPLDADKAGELTAGFAGFNGVLDAIMANPTLMTNFGLTADDVAARKVSFSASCTNRILLNDETLTDLGPVLDYLRSVGAIDTDEKRAALVPYEQARQSTATDVFPLSTGSYLGTPGYFGVWGVSEPLLDVHVIIPAEKEAISAARISFNASVQATVDANPTRLALADVNATLNTLVTNKAGVYNGVTITPNINPPTGIYSEDGVHPNTRGYAFISRTFIAAINAKFGSTIPLTDISLYSATGLPLDAD